MLVFALIDVIHRAGPSQYWSRRPSGIWVAGHHPLTAQRCWGYSIPYNFVVEIQRVRLADGSPISLELAQFPADAFPGLLEQQLSGSIYEILEKRYGLVTSQADERIEAVNATEDEAAPLGIKANSALLLITRITYDQHGTPCEFSRDLFRNR